MGFVYLEGYPVTEGRFSEEFQKERGENKGRDQKSKDLEEFAFGRCFRIESKTAVKSLSLLPIVKVYLLEKRDVRKQRKQPC